MKKENHYIFISQLRTDQMPGPPREGRLMCTLLLSNGLVPSHAEEHIAHAGTA